MYTFLTNLFRAVLIRRVVMGIVMSVSALNRLPLEDFGTCFFVAREVASHA